MEQIIYVLLCTDTVQYVCVNIAAITLYSMYHPQLLFTFMVMMPSNLATVRQVLDNNTIQL